MKKTIIFDLDGTLADIDIRRDKSLKPNGKLDWDIFADPKSITDWDKPNVPVIKMAQLFKADGFKIVIFSGRNDRSFFATKQWLKKHHYPLKLTTFGYPSFVGKNRGSIWTNKLDEKYIKKLLSDNLFLRDLSWRKKNKSVIQKLMVRDEKNKKLLNLINLHLKK